MPVLHSTTLPRSHLHRNHHSFPLLQGLGTQSTIKTSVDRAFCSYSHSLESGNFMTMEEVRLSPRSAQHHHYRYCPALLFPHSPGLLSPGALGISPHSLQAHASAIQSSQSIASSPGASFLPNPQATHGGHSRCQPHLTKTQWQVLFLIWSHYCISWTTPSGDVSGWSKVDPHRGRGNSTYTNPFVGGEGISLSDRLAVIYKSHTFVNQNLQVLSIIWWKWREATDVKPLKLSQLILQHGKSMAAQRGIC